VNPTLEDLAAAETEAIRARMRAEAAEALAVMLASDPITARVFHWQSWPHYVGLTVGGTVRGQVGDPFTHTFHDPNMAGILAELNNGICYIGNGCGIASNLGGTVGILVGGGGFTDSPPLGGMPTVDLFDRIGLGAHWRHAARLYAAERVAAIQAECQKAILEAKQRSAAAGISLAMVNAFCDVVE
jgi:hypothetical protein